MIYFDEKLIRLAEQLHDVKEYVDIFNDLAKIEQTINNSDIKEARRLDKELIEKYPIIKTMLIIANSLPKINGNRNTSSFVTQVPEFEYLIQDKFGIYAHILLKSKHIKDVKEFITYVD